MQKHLILVGGGHAHMITLANLNRFAVRGHRVTVIGPSEHHYYSGMGPGMIGGTYAPDEIRFATRHVVEKQGGTFVKGAVSRIDPKARTVFLQSGDSLVYDVISFNAGSHVPVNLLDGDSDRDVYTVKPIERLLEARQRMVDIAGKRHISVGVVGGGAAAVEVAGNVARLLRAHARHGFDVMIFSRNRLLERFPEKVRRAGYRSLNRRDIKVLEHRYVDRVLTGCIQLQTGERYHPDIIFLATGVSPSSIFRNSGLPTGPDGGLLVNRYLQCSDYPEIFGGGDCIYFHDHPLEKVGVYAVRQNPILYRNILASLEGESLTPFDPGGDYLLIFNMGDGTGIFYKRGVLLSGRLAFILKDRIDRRFMKKFQAIE